MSLFPVFSVGLYAFITFEVIRWYAPCRSARRDAQKCSEAFFHSEFSKTLHDLEIFIECAVSSLGRE